MTATRPRLDGALVAVVILLAGWVLSVGVRAWNRVEVDIVAELAACSLAAGGLYARMKGKPPEDGGAS